MYHVLNAMVQNGEQRVADKSFEISNLDLIKDLERIIKLEGILSIRE